MSSPTTKKVARATEASEEVLASKKAGQDILVYYFGSKNYSWLKENQVTAWDLDENSLEEAKKKNKAKSYQQGLVEAKEWKEGEQIFPVPTKATKAPESKASVKQSDKKRKNTEADTDAPPTKRTKKATQSGASGGDDDHLSDSEDDAPYKIPFPDPKKARKVRVMRKLGLYPPEGSLFKTAPPAQS